MWSQIYPCLVVSTHIFFINYQAWIRRHISISIHHYKFDTNKYARITRTTRQWMELRLNIMWFVVIWRCQEGIFGLSEWLGFWNFCYRQLGGHMFIVSVFLNYIQCFFFLYISTNTLLLFMCAMKNKISTSYLIAQHIFVIVSRNYVVDLTIPKTYVLL